MIGTHKNILSIPQLIDIPKTLKYLCIYQDFHYWAKVDTFMELIICSTTVFRIDQFTQDEIFTRRF